MIGEVEQWYTLNELILVFNSSSVIESSQLNRRAS
jgi:hypothetical protein